MEAESLQSMINNNVPQFFETLNPKSPTFPANSPFQSSSSLDKTKMADNLLVSDVLIIDLNNYRTSTPSKNNKTSKSKVNSAEKVVIELLDDEFGDNYGDDDCVFVKKEKNLMRLGGNHKEDPIYIDESFEKEGNFKGNVIKSKSFFMNVDDDGSVQCVDDYDDGNDEIRIINVVTKSKSSSPLITKGRKPFSGVTITEIGESSGTKVEEIEEVVAEVDPGEMMFVCEICADSRPRKESFRIKGCCHSYCSGCVENYVASKLQDGVSRIDCPVPSCSGVLEPEYCREILPFEVFVRWGNLLCESVILASQKFYCPFKDCSALLVDDGSEKVTMSECPTCYRLFCAQCKVGWHHGIGCAEYQALSKDEREKEDIMLRNLAKSKNWQRCPKCKFYVEKSQGCLYMKCRCGVAFCYSCGEIHTDHAYHYCKKCGR